MKVTQASALLLFLVLLQWEESQAACCDSSAQNYCGDGTRGTPCCGYGRCNIFCCACTCRRGKRQAPEDGEEQGAEEDSGSDPFVKYDVDQDGKIDMVEARRWLVAGGCGNPVVNLMSVSGSFQSLDTDGNGGLDRGEIGG